MERFWPSKGQGRAYIPAGGSLVAFRRLEAFDGFGNFGKNFKEAR
jgi:hypothetical protein